MQSGLVGSERSEVVPFLHLARLSFKNAKSHAWQCSRTRRYSQDHTLSNQLNISVNNSSILLGQVTTTLLVLKNGIRFVLHVLGLACCFYDPAPHSPPGVFFKVMLAQCTKLGYKRWPMHPTFNKAHNLFTEGNGS